MDYAAAHGAQWSASEGTSYQRSQLHYIVTCRGDYLDLLTTYTRLETTSNYSATANLHNSSVSRAQVLSSQTPVQN
jgi:hypothetical protein